MNCECGHEKAKHAAASTGCMVVAPDPCPCAGFTPAEGEHDATLRGCPFCGTPPEVREYPVGEEEEGRTECEIICGQPVRHIAAAYGATRADAAAQWNALGVTP